MKKLIFATGNENKMKEIRMILADCGYEILSMKEAGIQANIVEDGKTFEWKCRGKLRQNLSGRNECLQRRDGDQYKSRI